MIQNLSLVGSPSIMNMEACPFQKMKIDGIATNIKKKSYNALYYDLYGSRALFRLANIYLIMIHSHVSFRKEKKNCRRNFLKSNKWNYNHWPMIDLTGLISPILKCRRW